MEFDTEQLNQIEMFASRAFTPRDVAIIIGVPVMEFEILFTDEKHTAFLAYEKGRLKALMDLRNNIYASALSGSSPAQAEIAKLFTKQASTLNLLIHA